MISNPRVTSSNPRATISNPRVTSSNSRVTSPNPQIIKWIKTQVNSLKSCSFPKIVSPKLFGNSWLYVKFLVIISCFTFPLLHGYGFSRRRSDLSKHHTVNWVSKHNFERRNLNSPRKSRPPPDDFGEIFTRN